MMAPTDPQEGNPSSRNANDPMQARTRLGQSPLPSLSYNTPRPVTTDSYKYSRQPAGNIFFTRHNPHPKRVYHIRGLNNALVCKVDDEGICHKEPMKPPKRPISANIPITPAYPANIITGIPQPPCKEDGLADIGFLYSQAWREELRDLTARVDFFPEPAKKAKEEENLKWGTQCSGERGNRSPSPSRPISRTASRPSSRAGMGECTRPVLTVAEREILVLDLLSQILQTDSLQAVQQWLLITGQREKNMVLDMIRMAVANMRFGGPGSAYSSTSKESLSSHQSAEDTETTIFQAPCPCERRRARSQQQRLDSILEKKTDVNRDLKMRETTRPIASPRQYSPQPETTKRLKTIRSPRKVLNVPSSPILNGKLCHSKTDLYKT